MHFVLLLLSYVTFALSAKPNQAREHRFEAFEVLPKGGLVRRELGSSTKKQTNSRTHDSVVVPSQHEIAIVETPFRGEEHVAMASMSVLHQRPTLGDMVSVVMARPGHDSAKKYVGMDGKIKVDAQDSQPYKIEGMGNVWFYPDEVQIKSASATTSTPLSSTSSPATTASRKVVTVPIHFATTIASQASNTTRESTSESSTTSAAADEAEPGAMQRFIKSVRKHGALYAGIGGGFFIIVLVLVCACYAARSSSVPARDAAPQVQSPRQVPPSSASHGNAPIATTDAHEGSNVAAY